jgi:hypothetical protein
MPKKREKESYRVTIRDNAGDEQKFHCDNAISHPQGSAFAAALVDHFNGANPGNRFSAVEVKPARNKLNSTHVSVSGITNLVW